MVFKKQLKLDAEIADESREATNNASGEIANEPPEATNNEMEKRQKIVFNHTYCMQPDRQEKAAEKKKRRKYRARQQRSFDRSVEWE